MALSRQSRRSSEKATRREQRLLAVAHVAFKVIAFDPLDFRARAEYEADLLVQGFGLDVEHAFVAGARAAAGLLHQERDRIALVHEAQASIDAGLSGVARIHEDAAAHQDAMRLGDE